MCPHVYQAHILLQPWWICHTRNLLKPWKRWTDSFKSPDLTLKWKLLAPEGMEWHYCWLSSYIDNARERNPFNWCKLIEYEVAIYWSWLWIKTVGHVLFILWQKSLIFSDLSSVLSVCAHKMYVCVALMAAKYWRHSAWPAVCTL